MKIINENSSILKMRDLGAAIIAPIIGIIFLFIGLGGLEYFFPGKTTSLPTYVQVLFALLGCLTFLAPITTVTIENSTKTITINKQRLIFSSQTQYSFNDLQKVSIITVRAMHNNTNTIMYGLCFIMNDGRLIDLGQGKQSWIGNLAEIGQAVAKRIGVPFEDAHAIITDEQLAVAQKALGKFGGVLNIFKK